MEEVSIVYAGSNCDDKENKCKVWWLSTIRGRVHDVEVTIPYDDVPGKNDIQKEILLDDMFRNSRAKI